MSSFGVKIRNEENIFIRDQDIIYFLIAVKLLQKQQLCQKCSSIKINLVKNNRFCDNYCWECSIGHQWSIRKNSPFEKNPIPVKIFVSMVYFWAINSNMSHCVNYFNINNTIGETIMKIVNQVCHYALIRDPILLGGKNINLIAKIIKINSSNKYKRINCTLLCILDFYQEKKLVHLSIIHSKNPHNILTQIYQDSLPFSIIKIDNYSLFNQIQKENFEQNNNFRIFSPLTTRDIIILGEFVTQYIAKNTNMDKYIKNQLYTYIEHVMYRFKSAAKRPPYRTLFEDFMIEYQSQFNNLPNFNLSKYTDNEI